MFLSCYVMATIHARHLLLPSLIAQPDIITIPISFIILQVRFFPKIQVDIMNEIPANDCSFVGNIQFLPFRATAQSKVSL